MKWMFLGSSVVEQVAVNHLVAGSNPARGAIIILFVFSTDGLLFRAVFHFSALFSAPECFSDAILFSKDVKSFILKGH
jgi:hypothetical protein